jgi:hypothetical protein
MNVSHQKVWNSDFTTFSSLYFPIMPYGSIFAKFKNWPSIGDLNKYKPNYVCSFLSQSICFVEQKGARLPKCFSSLYEPRIFLKGEVNTRVHSWHDFFNALIWYTFPRIKSVLNMRQFIAFDERADFPWSRPTQTRTREQDFLTMFDEGGCILVTLSGHKNISLPFLFGHGFYERIAYGDRNLSACTLEINLDFTEYIESIKYLFMNMKNIENSDYTKIKSLLGKIDLVCSNILTNRKFYENETTFKAIHLSEFMNKIDDFCRFC